MQYYVLGFISTLAIILIFECVVSEKNTRRV